MLLLHLAPRLKADQCSERAGNPPCPMKRDLDPAQTGSEGRYTPRKAKPLSFFVRCAPCSGNSWLCSNLWITSVCPTSGKTSAAAVPIHISSTIPVLKDAPPHRLLKESFPLFLSPHHQSGDEHTSCALLIPGGTRLLQACPRRAPGIPPISVPYIRRESWLAREETAPHSKYSCKTYIPLLQACWISWLHTREKAGGKLQSNLPVH